MKVDWLPYVWIPLLSLGIACLLAGSLIENGPAESEGLSFSEMIQATQRPASVASADSRQSYYLPRSCGPVSLYAVCKLYDIDTSIAELVSLSGQNERGTTIAGLIQAAEAKGLVPKAYKSSVRHLRRIRGPAIIDMPTGHFCVFLGWWEQGAVILDAPQSHYLASSHELEHGWGKRLVTFDRVKMR